MWTGGQSVWAQEVRLPKAEAQSHTAVSAVIPALNLSLSRPAFGQFSLPALNAPQNLPVLTLSGPAQAAASYGPALQAEATPPPASAQEALGSLSLSAALPLAPIAAPSRTRDAPRGQNSFSPALNALSDQNRQASRASASAGETADNAASWTGFFDGSDPWRELEQKLQIQDPVDAALAYRESVRLALNSLPANRAEAVVAELETRSAARAPQAMRELADRAVREAQLGGLASERKQQFLEAFGFWHAQAVHGGIPAPDELRGRIEAIPETSPQPATWADLPKPLASPAREAFHNVYIRMRAEGSWRFTSLAAAYARLIAVRAGAFGDYLRDVWVTNKKKTWTWFKSKVLKKAEHAPAVRDLASLPSQWRDWPVSEAALEAPRPQAWTHGELTLTRAPEGLEVQPLNKGALTVRIRQGAQADEGLRERFASFNRLIENNFSALPLINKNARAMTRRTAESVYSKVRAMAEEYRAISGDAGPLAELEALWERLRPRLAALTELEYLDQESLDMVVPADKPSLHQMIQRVHQKAIEEASRVGGSFPPNLVLEVQRDGEPARQVGIIDLSRSPLIQNGRIVSPALKTLADMLARSKKMPEGGLFLQDDQFWAHFQLGWHSVEVYVALREVDEGGIVRVRYQEWDTHMLANRSRLRYIHESLDQIGAAVAEEKGFLTAVVDKDHRSQTPDRMAQTASLALQVLNATTGVDYALPRIMAGRSLDEEPNRGRVAHWARIALSEGGLPFFSAREIENPPAHAYPWWIPKLLRIALVALEKWFSFSLRAIAQGELLVRGYLQYLDGESSRQSLRAALDSELSRLGLPVIPPEQTIGQKTVDLYFSQAIDEALARGELLREEGGRLQRNPSYSPVRNLAHEALAHPADLAQMAQVVGSLDPALFEFETLGTAGTLHVRRAQRQLDLDRWLILHVMRDLKTDQIVFARAELGALGEPPRSLEPAEVFSLLAEQGLPVASFSPSERIVGLDRYLSKLSSVPEPDPEGAVMFRGLATSPGPRKPVVARVTFDRAKAAQGGYIYAAEYTTPDDLEAIRNSEAVITFSGGRLSHAAITTRELNKPAVILTMARRVKDNKETRFELKYYRFGQPERSDGVLVRSILSRKILTLREGAVVRIDPLTGQVEIPEDHRQTAIVQVADALALYEKDRDAASLVQWAQGWIASPIHHPARRMARLSELLSVLALRLGNDPEAAPLLARVRAGILAAAPELGPPIHDLSRHVFEIQSRATQEALDQFLEMIPYSESVETVHKLSSLAASQAERLKALNQTLERRDHDAASERARERISALAGRRTKELQRDNILEFEALSRALDSRTIEVEDAIFRLRALLKRAKMNRLDPLVYEPWQARLDGLKAQRKAAAAAELLVVPLSQVSRLDLTASEVGGKNLNLAEIEPIVREAGGHTAPGVALVVHAYRRFLAETGIGERLDALAARGDLTLVQKAEEAKRLLLSVKLSDYPIGREIMTLIQAESLGPSLAVRSSAGDEDGQKAAFAGAGDTRLYVPSEPEELLQNIQEVWASVWNSRALVYREEQASLRGAHLDLSNLSQAEVIQAMVPSAVAGVTFTRDPVSGHPGWVVVNASIGLGEAIVSGLVTPDEYILDKRTGEEIRPAIIAYKARQIVARADGRGTYEASVPPHQRRARSLSPEQLKFLNRVVTALEGHYGYALDIEFAFANGRLYVLQARPVTTH